MNSRLQPKQAGFTLIELSIVLVIIGLIVGGILVGRDLIQAARLRAVITQIQNYQTAVGAFQIKYNCLPGDCPTATDWWGARPGGCNSGNYTTSYTIPTCNGNGNGRLVNALDTSDNADNTTEAVLFWQHLANAGLVSGGYVGVKDGLSYLGVVPGVNVPLLNNYQNVSVMATYQSSNISSWYRNTNYYSVGVFVPAASLTWGAFLTVTEAQAMDMKFDDGQPLTGKMLSDSWSNPGPSYANVPEKSCITSTWMPDNPTYQKLGVGLVCNLFIEAGF